MQSSLRSHEVDNCGNGGKRLCKSDSYVCFLFLQMSSSGWQTATVTKGCETVFERIRRPGDNQDRLICSLRLLKAFMQKAREKCTQSLQIPCFVSIAFTNALLILCTRKLFTLFAPFITHHHLQHGITLFSFRKKLPIILAFLCCTTINSQPCIAQLFTRACRCCGIINRYA